MNSKPDMLRKDIRWQVKNSEYVVKNVPYFQDDYDGEELLDVNVSITLTALRDLMIEEAIPANVDYRDFADIKF